MIKRYILPTVIPENMALVGATAMLAGVQRTTVSLCIIMMEATGETKVLIPLIIGVVVARYVADWFNEGFYHVSFECHNQFHLYLEFRMLTFASFLHMSRSICT
jgi:H+/Cl- antiporter ClcA